MDPESIASFVAQFHRDQNFLPDEQPFFPGVSDDAIKQKAQRLYDDINGVLPQTEKTVRRWSYFRLLLPKEAVDGLKEIDNTEEIDVGSLAQAVSVVDSSGVALPHFGYADDTRDISLVELADRWRQVVRSPNSKWVDKLCAEMWRGVNNYTPKLKWRPIKSAQGEGNYSVLLIVNQVDFRKDGGVEFSVNTYKAPLSSDQIGTEATTATLWAGAV